MTIPERIRNAVVGAVTALFDAVDRRRATTAARERAVAEQVELLARAESHAAAWHEQLREHVTANVGPTAERVLALGAQVEALGRRLDEVFAAVGELQGTGDDRAAALAEEIRAVHEQVDRTADRLVDTQALVARVYDAGEDGPGKLRAMRTAGDYERAWEDPDPRVSIRIATYNRGQILCERALASVLRQTHTNWECIVVGDALTDDTPERIAALGDPRIRFVNLPYRGPYPEADKRRWFVAGIPPANRALEEATGLWIAPLDDDDEWDDDHIEVLLGEARRTHAELVYGRVRVLEVSTGKILSHEVGVWPPVFGQFTLQAAIQHAGLTAFPFDLNTVHAGEPGDWNLGRRLWEAGTRFAYLDRAVTTYFWTPVDDSARPAARE